VAARAAPYPRGDRLLARRRAGAGPRAGRGLARFLALLRNLALVSGVVALARPRAGAHAVTSTSEGINIVVAFDISSSMLAQDFQPQNRLEVARERIKSFVKARSSIASASSPFSGEALTQVPLTTDYPVVQAALDNLQPGQLEDGTAIGTAIATAANRLRDAPGKSKVMILLTDGVNNRGSIDPRTAAKAASAFGIRIYGIGVGTKGWRPVPVGRGCSVCATRCRRWRSTTRCSPTSPTATEAGISGARSGRAAAHHEQIDALERSPVRSAPTSATRSCFRWPLR
jgi:Ca-activated chloride channel family protein